MKLFSAIYIGSYEMTMKVFQINKGKALKEIDCLKIQVDIIRDVIESGSITFGTTDRVCRVLNDMKRTMESYNVNGYSVFVSSNIRNATNDLFFLEQIKIRTGLSVTVVSNSEQRFLGYEAVASWDDFDSLISESALLVDIGGMSLQITLFVQGRIVTTQHILLGTVSVSEQMKKLGSINNAVDQANEMMFKELDVFKTMFLRDIKPKYMILLGDQINSVSDIFNDFVGRKIKCEDYLKFLSKLNKEFIRSLAAEHEIFLNNEKLAEPFIMIHKAIALAIEPKYVLAPGLSVCDGMAIDFAKRKKWISLTHDFDEDILSAAWAISLRYGSYQPHLKALVKLSTQMFDSMKKFHGMGKRERILMQAVAILHDCGKYISIAEASKCSYTIIMSSEILGLTHKEREMIATVVALNRKQLETYEELSDKFTQDEYMVIVKLLAILKVANALDRSHKQKIKKVSMRVKDSELLIMLESNTSLALEKGLFAKNADFFEMVFSIRPVLNEKKINF